jgi:hypothetical protein
MATLDELDKAALLVDMYYNDVKCGLSHGKESIENFNAIDYLSIPLGDLKTGEQSDTFIIPICKECIEALHGDEWILIACLSCSSNVWVLRDLAKLKYFNANTGQPYHLIAVVGCPSCTKKLEKIFYL